MAILFKNNAFTTLAAGLGSGVTTMTVVDGSFIQAVVAPDVIFLVIEDSAGTQEVVKCTAHTAASTSLTIERAQESTADGTWLAGDVVELRLTAGELANYEAQVALLSSVAGTNTITATAPNAPTAYFAGQTFRFVAAGTNTGAVTLNIGGLGAKAVTKSGTSAMDAGDIVSGAVVQVTYDGTQFQLVSGAGGGAKAGGAIYENTTTINDDYTLTTGKNGHSVGPISVSGGVAVTVPSGARWVVI